MTGGSWLEVACYAGSRRNRYIRGEMKIDDDGRYVIVVTDDGFIQPRSPVHMHAVVVT